jgi:hypothetical protein
VAQLFSLGDFERMKYFEVIIGVLFIAVGVTGTLGIWIPSLRGQWKGEKFSSGRLSSAGFGLMFITIGLTFLLGDGVKSFKIWLEGLVIITFFLVVSGRLFDSLTHNGGRGVYRLPGESQITPQKRSRWIGAACGALLLLILLLVIFFHG